MAIISYPIFNYESHAEYESNFKSDLKLLGICIDSDAVKTMVQEIYTGIATKFVVLITKVERGAKNPPPNN